MSSQRSLRSRAHRSTRLPLIIALSVGTFCAPLGCDDDSASPDSGGSIVDSGRADTLIGGSAIDDAAGEALTPEDALGGEFAAGVMAGIEADAELEAGDQIADAGAPEAGALTEPVTHDFPPAPEGYPRFSFPIHEADRALMRASPVFGFDHDPQEGNRIRCTDYAGRGFPHCYDGHEGSDFMLEGGFEAMDSGSARIVAALAGEVVAVEDGNYDRCHADLFNADVSCDGYPMRANFVRIRHDNGWVSLYYHLKSGSVQVRRGQRVTCGEFLGLVGSSGYSSSPHLHFEVIDRRSDRWDPFAGSESQAFSLWTYQPESSSEGIEMMSPASLPSNSCSSPSK